MKRSGVVPAKVCIKIRCLGWIQFIHKTDSARSLPFINKAKKITTKSIGSCDLTGRFVGYAIASFPYVMNKVESIALLGLPKTSLTANRLQANYIAKPSKGNYLLKLPSRFASPCSWRQFSKPPLQRYSVFSRLT